MLADEDGTDDEKRSTKAFMLGTTLVYAWAGQWLRAPGTGSLAAEMSVPLEELPPGNSCSRSRSGRRCGQHNWTLIIVGAI